MKEYETSLDAKDGEKKSNKNIKRMLFCKKDQSELSYELQKISGKHFCKAVTFFILGLWSILLISLTPILTVMGISIPFYIITLLGGYACIAACPLFAIPKESTVLSIDWLINNPYMEKENVNE